MTDPTTTPAPTTSPELFDKATLLALFPGILPADAPASMTAALTTMLSECIDATNKAGEAGATPLLAKVVLETMSLICTNSAMWVVTDYNAALAAAGQPPTAPIVATPAPPAAPTPPEPAPAPGSAPAPPAAAPLPMVGGVSTVTVGPGDVVTLVVGEITKPDVDVPVVLAIALDPSTAGVAYPAYSLELKYSVHDGFTYTAGTIWPGITLYGKPGDLMQLSVDVVGFVQAQISQDGGTLWTPFFYYPTPIDAPLYAHLATTTNGPSGGVTALL